MDRAVEYIKATTAFGGDEYGKFSRGYSDENREAFEKWAIGQPKADGVTLFRGYCFEPHYWADGQIEEGGIIGEDQMTAENDLPAFCEDKIRASLYIRDYGGGNEMNDGVRVLFEIKTSGKYFVDVSSYSIYPQEHEYRCIRNTSLKVESITNRGFLLIKCKEI